MIRFDVFNYSNAIPSNQSVKEIKLKIYDYNLSDDMPNLTEIGQELTFKSDEAIAAVTNLQKQIMPLNKTYKEISKNDEENLPFIVVFNYSLKPFGTEKREYGTNYIFRDEPSLMLPLIKTEEYKEQYYTLLHAASDNTLVFVEPIKNKESFKDYIGYIAQNEPLVAELRETMIMDADNNTLDYMAQKDIQFEYSIQIIIKNGAKQTGPKNSKRFYIPASFTNTIAFLETHNADIFKKTGK